MNIEQYVKIKKESKKFLIWLSEKRQVMLDWNMDAQGITISNRYDILKKDFDNNTNKKG